MLSIGGLNFPAVWGVARGYSCRLTVVSRGLILGGAYTPGKGERERSSPPAIHHAGDFLRNKRSTAGELGVKGGIK